MSVWSSNHGFLRYQLWKYLVVLKSVQIVNKHFLLKSILRALNIMGCSLNFGLKSWFGQTPRFYYGQCLTSWFRLLLTFFSFNKKYILIQKFLVNIFFIYYICYIIFGLKVKFNNSKNCIYNIIFLIVIIQQVCNVKEMPLFFFFQDWESFVSSTQKSAIFMLRPQLVKLCLMFQLSKLKAFRINDKNMVKMGKKWKERIRREEMALGVIGEPNRTTQQTSGIHYTHSYPLKNILILAYLSFSSFF